MIANARSLEEATSIPRDRRRVMLTMGATLFANFIALLGLTPLYPTVAKDLGLGPDGFGLYLAIQGAVNVVLQVPVGVLADKVGRKPVMAVGLLFLFLGQVFRWRATDAYTFGVGQAFVGLCGPFIVAAAYALVADTYQAVGRAQAIGGLQVAINLGSGAGYLLAGLLSPYVGWRGFSLAVAALPVILLPLVLRMPEPRPSGVARSFQHGMVAALAFLINPRAAALTFVVTFNIGAGMGATYLLPFVARNHGLNSTGTSILLIPFLVGAVAGGLPAGRWADRVGQRTPTLISLAVAALGIGAFAIFGFGPISVAICFLVVGAAISATAGLIATAVVDLANHHGHGTGAALGGMRVGLGLGASAAPPLVGLVFVRGGESVAYLSLAAAAVVAGVVFAIANQPSNNARPDRKQVIDEMRGDSQ